MKAVDHRRLFTAGKPRNVTRKTISGAELLAVELCKQWRAALTDKERAQVREQIKRISNRGEALYTTALAAAYIAVTVDAQAALWFATFMHPKRT